MKLYLNCDNNESESFTKKNYLLAAANRLGISDQIEEYIDGEVENVLNIEPFTKFVKGTKWTGIWEIDLLCDRVEASETNWVESDVVFIAISTIPKRLEPFRHKTELLFQACDPMIHKRLETIKQEYDFVFCGSLGIHWYTERERVMELLRKSEFTFKDFPKGEGPGKYVENINHAKVQFIRSMKTNVADGELAQRFFECLAIGPVLTNYVEDLKYTGLIEGEDYMAYRDDGEMLKNMKLLTFDPELAQRIADNGRKKALTYHTYEHRLVTILQHLQDYGK